MPKGLKRFLFIALLASLACAQPLFDLLGQQAEFFVAQGWGARQLVTFAIVLSLGLPALSAALPALSDRAHPSLGSFVAGLLAFVLGMLIFLPPAFKAGLDGYAALGASLVAAVLLVHLYRKFQAVQLFFQALSPAIIVFPVAFLFFSRAADLVSDTDNWTGGGDGAATDVVFIVLDEFPAVSLLNSELEIDAGNYPNFARLARTANWYPMATTGADLTVHALTEALTGVQREAHSDTLPIAASYPRNLFTLLSGSHDMHVVETSTLFCPREICRAMSPATTVASRQQPVSDLLLVYAHLVVPPLWAEQLPGINNAWSGFTREKEAGARIDQDLEQARVMAEMSGQMRWRTRSEEFIGFVDRISAGDRPALHYLHALLPHVNWRYLPDGKTYLLSEDWEGLASRDLPATDGRTVVDRYWLEDEWAVQQAWQRHLLQVRYVDRLLGRLLDRLEGQGLFDGSLVIVLGDHGASFIPGAPRRVIDQVNRSDIAGVPLIIKLPGQKSGQRVPHQATLTDLMPTIVEALDMAPGWSFTGNSLLDPKFPQRGGIDVLDSTGRRISYPAAAHESHLRERARQKATWFGQGENTQIYATGPNAGLIGQTARDLAIDRPESAGLVIDSEWLYADVDPASGFLPLQVKGRLSAFEPDNGPAFIAVAVNGTISAVSRTYLLPGAQQKFSALLPPDALQPGFNELDIYRVRQGASLTSLSLLGSASSGDRYTLAGHAGSESISAPGLDPVPVLGAEAAGNVASQSGERGTLFTLTGTVRDPGLENRKVVVFQDGRHAANTQLKGKGFSLSLRSRGAGADPESRIRVFVLWEDGVREFTYPPPCAAEWHFAPPPAWQGIDCRVDDGLQVSPDEPVRINFHGPGIRPYLGTGWQVEEGISWTVGVRAGLRLPVVDDSTALAFKASVKPFLAPPALSEQMVFLLANGQEVARWVLDGSEFSTLSWEVPAGVLARSGTGLELEFLLPYAASPLSLGAGTDARALGLAFVFLEINAARAQPAVRHERP